MTFHDRGNPVDCLDSVLNRGACNDACLSGDVTCSFWLHNIKLFKTIRSFCCLLTIKIAKIAESSVFIFSKLFD